jgi:hypothetical protein
MPTWSNKNLLLPAVASWPDFRRGAVHVVGVNLDNDRHVVRRAALIDDVIHDELFAADARALVDGALDGVLRDAFLFRLFHAVNRRAFIAESAPPILAATEISRTSLPVARPFLSPATSRLACSHWRPMERIYQTDVSEFNLSMPENSGQEMLVTNL